MKLANDYKAVVSIVSYCTKKLEEFAEVAELVSDLWALHIYNSECNSIFESLKLSEEAKKTHDNNLYRYRKALRAYKDIEADKYFTEVDFEENPDYFYFLGTKYTVNMVTTITGVSGDTFEEVLEKEAFESFCSMIFHLCSLLDDILDPMYESMNRYEKAISKCGVCHCDKESSSTKEPKSKEEEEEEEFIKDFLNKGLGLDLDDVDIRIIKIKGK